jgi:hypothetical protein
VPFTRATTATRTNAAGLIELVPYNSIFWSEDISNGIWTKNNTVVTTNTTISPDGKLTADSLADNSTFLSHVLIQAAPFYTSPTTLTFSCYLKEGSARYAGFRVFVPTDGIDVGRFAIVIDLQTGIITSTLTSGQPITNLSYSVISVGNGWYRAQITGLTPAGAASLMCFCTPTGTPVNDGFATTIYSGTGQSYYVWGAQINEGTLLPYQLTETRLNRPRVDFSLGGCPNLLLEPQRTNLATFSEQFDNAAWVKSNTSVTANSTTSPSGLVNADTLTADGTSNQHVIQQPLSFTLNVAYSISFYVKKSTNNFVQICTYNVSGGQFANFDINSGVVGTLGVTFGTAPTSSITSVGDGWYRCTMTFTASATASSGVVIALVSSSSAARLEVNTLNTSVFLWGAQIELGAYPTSYIPTTAATVTRNTDTFQLSNVFTNNMISSAGGTWFVDLRNNIAKIRDNSGAMLLGVDGNNCFRIRNISAALSRFTIDKNIAGISTNLFTTTTDNVKLAIKWNGTTGDVFVNGVKVVTATAFTFTALQDLISSAGIPFYINSMSLYNTPISDAECIAITTL